MEISYFQLLGLLWLMARQRGFSGTASRAAGYCAGTAAYLLSLDRILRAHGLGVVHNNGNQLLVGIYIMMLNAR